jgi:3'(2'), 5'-bisphosphate nucleotidase
LNTYRQELDAALDAVGQAGQAILERYHLFEAIVDAPADITTAADHEAQEIVLRHLHQQFPEDGFCAEERTPALADARQSGPRLWIVDPIDGTRGFARKNGEFSVMVALLHEQRIALGVVLEPVRERLTYAVRGEGCWRRDANVADAMPCQVRPTETLSAATLTQSHSKDPATPSRRVKALGPRRVIESYSAGIKLALVARGEADVYVNSYGAFHDWDACAGHILVEEAGGKVTGLGGETLRYGLPGAWQRNGLLATNRVLHSAALAALRSA